jgi:glycogen debranching enzyme
MTRLDALPEFALTEIPFSSRGSWLDLSRVVAPERIAETVHLVSHRHGMNAVLELIPLLSGSASEPVPDPIVSATPAVLTWTSSAGTMAAVFDGTDRILVKGRGMDLRLRDAREPLPFEGSYLFADALDGSFTFSSNETGHRYRVTVLSGLAAQDPEGESSGKPGIVVAGAEWEIALEEFATARAPFAAARAFDEVVQDQGTGFRAYVDALASWRTSETPAVALACYVLWSATVEPAGLLGREAVLMSKHWMDRVWSWDNCFNALALAPGHPDEALDQFLVVFDHQDASGALPDVIGHSFVSYGYVKPPVQGWTLRRLRQRLDLSPDVLREVFDKTARLTEFWLRLRRRPGHRLPYYQHGNDSGWDNATLFDVGRVLETPDLGILVAIQLDVLAEIADELADPRADAWRSERDAIVAAVLAELWTGDTFVAVTPDGRTSSTTSLLRLIPLVGADLLPREVVDALTAQVRGHLTEHGLATERPDSPLYEPDGYWRGPIWGPPTLLLEDGLRRSGAVDLADDISARYRALCERSGFAENFDALTGEGLRDRAYTWTASCYLELARAAVG